MSANISNNAALGKRVGVVFTRQAPVTGAPHHPTLLESFRAWRARRAARAELFALSDRDLADIGLTRLDIEDVVKTHA